MENTGDSQPVTNDENEANEPIPPNVFLIMEGVRAIPLNQVCVTLGRSLDNTVVIDNPRISRHHAEIRVFHGNFVLFDLNSSGGTYLNGKRANQAILYPGDLISLAGINFVFTQDTRLVGRTDELKPEGLGKRATVIFDGIIRKDHPK